MTAKAALCELLLNGKVLNIKNCFSLVGLTNCPREISRMIEQPFQVNITRTNKSGKSRYGQSVVWIDYKLLPTDENKEGIEKMREYYKSQTGKDLHVSPPVVQVIAHTRQLKKEITPTKSIQQKLLVETHDNTK